MTQLLEHPTVKKHRLNGAQPPHRPLEAARLRRLMLECGADDVGFVEIGRAELGAESEHIRQAYPPAKTLVSFVLRMNRESIRAIDRSVANLEFHRTGDEVNDVARRFVRLMEADGVGALNPSMGFPMEMDRFPGRIWVLSHKPVAVAAGLGRMGVHRNVIHPRFGNFILLGTVILDAEIDEHSAPVDYNPCLTCKLCVAACPTGAIGADGSFDFAACYTHNYREFMGGFTDWVETIASSGSTRAYREKVTNAETTSMWQSLSFGANYKAAYCLSVCPAGEDVIGPFLDDRQTFLDRQVRPLRQKPETVYVVAGSDAEAHVAKRFPAKTPKRVANGLRPASIDGFLNGLPIAFQPGQSKGLSAVYHFRFRGREPAEATVRIHDEKVEVTPGLTGRAGLRLTADSDTWLRFLAKDANLVWALLRGKIRLKGSPGLLLKFAACFPS